MNCLIITNFMFQIKKVVIINCYKCEIHFSTKEIIEEDDKRVAFSGVDEENV